jgi:hypothetical protein
VALAIDASSPAAVTSTTSTVTTASFTPPAGALLEISWSADSQLGVNPSAPSITDNLGAHLTYTPQAWQSRADAPNVDGQCAIWTAPVVTSAAMTITVTNNAGAGIGGAVQVRVWTDGGNTPTVGAKGKAGSASASSIAQSYTAQATGGQGVIAVCDDDELGAETAGTGCTMDASGIVSAANAYGFARRTIADDSNGGSNTLNVTLPSTSLHLGWVYVEILPAVPSGDVDPGPRPRTLPQHVFYLWLTAQAMRRPPGDDYLSTATTSVHPATTADIRKQATAASTCAQHAVAATAATAVKATAAATTGGPHVAVVAAGGKGAAAPAAVGQRSTVTPASRKQAAGSGNIIAHPTATPTGRKQATAAGITSVHPADTTTIRKQATGTGTAPAHPASQAAFASVAPSGAGVTSGRPTVAAAGAKATAGGAAVAQHGATVSTTSAGATTVVRYGVEAGPAALAGDRGQTGTVAGLDPGSGAGSHAADSGTIEQGELGGTTAISGQIG